METTPISRQRLLFPLHPVTSTSPWYHRRHSIHIIMFANLLEARTGAGAGAAECHRDVTGTTFISLQRLLFPLHHCDIHELELELELVASA